MIATVPHPKLARHGIANALKTQRDTGYESETNDCFVHAMAAVTGIPYRDAHSYIAREFGRKPRKGTFGVDLTMDKLSKGYIYGYVPQKQNPVIGWKTKKTYYGYTEVNEYQTLGRFLLTHKQGRYLLWSNRHAFAVIDGTVYDNGAVGAKTQITGVYRFVPSSQL